MKSIHSHGRKLADGSRSIQTHLAILDSANSSLDDILTPYPEAIKDGRSADTRSPAEKAAHAIQATALQAEHIRTHGQFFPSFPQDRDSISPTEYRYHFKFTIYGKIKTYKLKFTKDDLEDQNEHARK